MQMFNCLHVIVTHRSGHQFEMVIGIWPLMWISKKVFLQTIWNHINSLGIKPDAHADPHCAWYVKSRGCTAGRICNCKTDTTRQIAVNISCSVYADDQQPCKWFDESKGQFAGEEILNAIN